MSEATGQRPSQPRVVGAGHMDLVPLPGEGVQVRYAAFVGGRRLPCTRRVSMVSGADDEVTVSVEFAPASLEVHHEGVPVAAIERTNSTAEAGEAVSVSLAIGDREQAGSMALGTIKELMAGKFPEHCEQALLEANARIVSWGCVGEWFRLVVKHPEFPQHMACVAETAEKATISLLAQIAGHLALQNQCSPRRTGGDMSDRSSSPPSHVNGHRVVTSISDSDGAYIIVADGGEGKRIDRYATAVWRPGFGDRWKEARYFDGDELGDAHRNAFARHSASPNLERDERVRARSLRQLHPWMSLRTAYRLIAAVDIASIARPGGIQDEPATDREVRLRSLIGMFPWLSPRAAFTFLTSQDEDDDRG